MRFFNELMKIEFSHKICMNLWNLVSLWCVPNMRWERSLEVVHISKYDPYHQLKSFLTQSNSHTLCQYQKLQVHHSNYWVIFGWSQYGWKCDLFHPLDPSYGSIGKLVYSQEIPQSSHTFFFQSVEVNSSLHVHTLIVCIMSCSYIIIINIFLIHLLWCPLLSL
jgi:hypothetical protein